MEMLNYSPNSIARSLRSQKTDMLGLVVADLGHEFFMQVAKGLENAIAPHDFNMIIASSDSDVGKERKILPMLLEKRVAALIVASFDNDSTILRNFMEADIPVIMVDRVIKGFTCDSIVLDNFGTSYRLTQLLLSNGHRNIAIANILLNISSGIERYEGFIKALEDHGIRPNSRYISGDNFDREACSHWVKKVFSMKNPPTALVCANNIMTIGALLAFKEMGIRVPEDVSLVSMGKFALQSLIEPKITASIHDGFAMGQLAGEIAINRIQKGKNIPIRQEVIVPEIVDNGSVTHLRPDKLAT